MLPHVCILVPMCKCTRVGITWEWNSRVIGISFVFPWKNVSPTSLSSISVSFNWLITDLPWNSPPATDHSDWLRDLTHSLVLRTLLLDHNEASWNQKETGLMSSGYHHTLPPSLDYSLGFFYEMWMCLKSYGCHCPGHLSIYFPLPGSVFFFLSPSTCLPHPGSISACVFFWSHNWALLWQEGLKMLSRENNKNRSTSFHMGDVSSCQSALLSHQSLFRYWIF